MGARVIFVVDDTLSESDLWKHMRKHHDETDQDLVDLVEDAALLHKDKSPEWLLELVHNRQHTSLDWDAGHDEDDI